jgi:hypothetical protein
MPSSGKCQLEEISTLYGVTRQYYHAVTGRPLHKEHTPILRKPTHKEHSVNAVHKNSMREVRAYISQIRRCAVTAW